MPLHDDVRLGRERVVVEVAEPGALPRTGRPQQEVVVDLPAPSPPRQKTVLHDCAGDFQFTGWQFSQHHP